MLNKSRESRTSTDDLAFFVRVAELEESVSSQTSVLRGSLNINASFGFGRRHVAPCVSRFAALHPGLAMSLQLSSQPLNFLDARVDIDIRVGEPPDARLIARKLRTNPRVLCCPSGAPPMATFLPSGSRSVSCRRGLVRLWIFCRWRCRWARASKPHLPTPQSRHIHLPLMQLVIQRGA